jgi:hypothetical protein
VIDYLLFTALRCHRYLAAVGCKRIAKLMDKDGHGELLEAILDVLLNSSIQGDSDNNSEFTEQENSDKISVADSIKWLQGICQMKCFGLSYLFVNSGLRSRLSRWIEVHCSDAEVLGSLQSSYNRT